MGWLDWIRETAGKVTTAIETGLRGIIGLPEGSEPYHFIEEALPDEAIRLARGVLESEPLTNVARVRRWTAQGPGEIPPSANYQITVRGVIIAPDGQMTHVDVAFPTGEAYSYDEFVKRAASALDNDFAAGYEIGRSDIIRQWTVATESYIQSFVPL